MYKGTYQPNRKPVISTAPDCLVFINGETSLPSGANPNRRVPVQPLITAVNVNVGVNSVPGSASINMHIPNHYLDDLYIGDQLTLTTMMEVQVYAKGHFTVGGAPRYYPLFWGVITSLDEGYAAGEQTVSLSCADILYWWQVSQININPSYLATQVDQTQQLALRGHTFTGMNAFDIIYSLSRYVYGDSMNVRNQAVDNRQFRSEPISGAERKRMMAYWTLKWGRITQNLKMFGPSGQVLQGGQLAGVLTGENRDFFLRQRAGSSKRTKLKDFEPFKQDFFDPASISPFTQSLSQLGSIEIENSEFETKLNLALQAKEAIGYEFYMDVTGEIIFKPPFYNMDVRPNFPVSWIRDVDVINWNFAENPPEATYIEATGRYTQNVELALNSLVQTKATYVDYRLVQKFGWRPGSFSSEFIGSEENGGPKALFYHLVDVLDRQNARVNAGTVVIPFRPELRLGYPVYLEGKDAYYYIEGISHSFSYGSRCTTTLTLMARRNKFRGAFERWRQEQAEPKPGDIALPGDFTRDISARPRDVQGRPLGDRNVIMTYIPEQDFSRFAGVVPTFKDDATDADRRLRNLVDLRSQFGNVTDNRYVYAIDPNRDQAYAATEENNRQRGPITHIEADPKIQLAAVGVNEDGSEQTETVNVNAVVFPISDEAGYEVVGSYEYGRRVAATTTGYRFDRTQDDVAVELLLNLAPESNNHAGQESPNINARNGNANVASAYEADLADKTLQLDPNNYGRRLSEIAPPDVSSDPTFLARVQGETVNIQGASASTPATAAPDPTSTNSETTDRGVVRKSAGGKTFKYNSNVARWRPTIRQVREELGLSEGVYSDEAILAVIHVESRGNPNARRTNKDGELSQFVGLMQIGEANAKESFRGVDTTGTTNVSFQGDGEASIRHFLRYADKFKALHDNDPEKVAILWKGGPGTLERYNTFLATNPTAQEQQEWLDEYPRQYKPDKAPWRLGEYVSREEAAREVWVSALDPVGPTDMLDDGNPAVKEEAVLGGDEANDPAMRDQINEVGIPDFILDPDPGRVQRFAEILEANSGARSLPAGVTPPRDPGVTEALNKFLLRIYAQDFQTGRARERRLRGEDRVVQPPPPVTPVFGAETPVVLPIEATTQGSLARDEITDRLANGETLGQILGTEIRTATEDERLRLDRAQRDLDDALARVSGREPEVNDARLGRGENLSALTGESVTESVTTATGLTEEDQTRIAQGEGDLDETTSLLDELRTLLSLDE